MTSGKLRRSRTRDPGNAGRVQPLGRSRKMSFLISAAFDALGRALPVQPITLAMYPQLPPDENTDASYERLAKIGGKHPQ
jgi:hypothetical protein